MTRTSPLLCPMLRVLTGRFFALLCMLGAFWFSGATFAQAGVTSSLLIGEVNWAGSSRSIVDEWLELWNRSNQPIDLTGYRLTGAGGSKDIVFNGSAVIPPFSAFLVANYPASDTKSGLATDPQIVTSTISLPNDKLLLQLFDADGNLVDQAGDGGLPPAGISSSTKSSMIRLQDGAWQTATDRQHFDDSVADFGTPGICDGCSWIVVEEATSTTIVIEEATTTIIEVTTTEIFVAATTTLELPVQTPEPIPEVVAVPPVTAVIEIQLPDLRLAKIFPAPSAGKEWVELDIPASVPADALKGWSLYDAAGKIMTIGSASSNHIEIPSSRLNNGGDTVELHRPDGSIAERMSYTSTPHDAFWEKNADQTAWVLNDPNAEPPTPIETPEPEVVTTYLPSPPPIELPTLDATGDERSDFSETGEEPKTETRALEKPVSRKSQAKAGPVTKKAKAGPVADKSITFDMLTKIEPNVRVVITGVVATKPGILNKNQFVLLSADGHGLLVYGTSKQPSPALGTTVRVAGTLQLNDDGLSLHLATKDRWTEIKTTSVPQPRVVDFLSSSAEDGWSFVDVTATVGEVKSSGAALDLGDVLATLHAKPVTGYRLSRLKQGDTIRVKALVDMRGLDPVLVLRSVDDIEIVKHAALAKAGEPVHQGLPDWTPFGAAGITVAITQGFKKLKQLREERRVRELIAQAPS